MNSEARTALEGALAHRFVRPEHLAEALTHRSFGEGTNNEKLEFLGDAVLALAMADLLMARFPEAREGDLSKMRASLVNAEVLGAHEAVRESALERRACLGGHAVAVADTSPSGPTPSRACRRRPYHASGPSSRARR